MTRSISYLKVNKWCYSINALVITKSKQRNAVSVDMGNQRVMRNISNL